MLLHTYPAKTAFGDFCIAVKASEFSRADAITVAQNEFGGVAARVGHEVTIEKKLPASASEVKSAKGWAWIWRATI